MSDGYHTRLRSRTEKQQAKYDEIFEAVVHPSERDSVSSEPSEIGSSSDSFTKSKKKRNNGSTKKSFPPLVCPSCNALYEKHSQFHAHIALEHGKTLIKCNRCNATSRSLWRTNVCQLCRSFSSNPSEHEADHYRDRLGDNALFECSHCYRAFTRFPDLKKHLSTSHQKKRLLREYHCQMCSSSFYSRHLRDQHFVSHFQSVIDKVWKTICSMQDRLGDKLQSNQCPICHFVMSSNRSFRLHVIHRHLLHDFHGVHELEALAKEIGIKSSMKDFSIGRILAKKDKTDIADLKTDTRNNNKSCLKKRRRKTVTFGVIAKEKEHTGTSEKITQSEDVTRKSSVPNKEISDTVQETTAAREGYQTEEERKNPKKSIPGSEVVSEHNVVRSDDEQTLQNISQAVCSTIVSSCPGEVSDRKNDSGNPQEVRQSAELQETVNVKELRCLDRSQQSEQFQQLESCSDEPLKIRKLLIAACLDKNSQVPRCTNCGDCFTRMFDFEVHLMRRHLSLAFDVQGK